MKTANPPFPPLSGQGLPHAVLNVRLNMSTSHDGAYPNPPVMTEGDIIQMLREFYEGLFPKTCVNCGRVFATLPEYVLASQRLWPSLNYDMELGNYNSPHPIGGLAMANCPCGTTLALSTKTMALARAHMIVAWIKAEMERRCMKQAELSDYLRDEVRKQILVEPTRGTATALRGAAGSQTPDPGPVPASLIARRRPSH